MHTCNNNNMPDACLKASASHTTQKTFFYSLSIWFFSSNNDDYDDSDGDGVGVWSVVIRLFLFV